MKSKNNKFTAQFIIGLMELFIISAFALLSIKDGVFDSLATVVGVSLGIYLFLQYQLLKKAFVFMDRFALLTAQFLFTIGMVLLYRMNPDNAIKQFAIYIGSSMLMTIIILLSQNTGKFIEKYHTFVMVITFLLLLAPAIIGRTIGGAKNWISIAGISIQPSEFAKVLYIIVSSYYLNTRSDLKQFIPYAVFTGMCVLVLVAEKDLGAALLISGTFIIMFMAATDRKFLTLIVLALFAVGAIFCTKFFPHVQTRIDVWKDPWSSYYGSGYQIVQGLIALASGGFFGTGLGMGLPSVIPASSTDYIFAVIGEEFGMIVAVCVILFYVLFVVRGILIAVNAKNTYDALVVFGCCSILSLQSFIIIGGVIKLIPLTGITLPFISSGGTSLLNSMIILGIIEGIAVKNGKEDERKLEAMEDVIL